MRLRRLVNTDATMPRSSATPVSFSMIEARITQSGASTCGTEIVYRIGVTRTQAEVRELDPATNKFVEKAED